MKEWSSCHDILRSLCSKSACLVDGKRPVMIVAASASRSRTNKRFEDYSFDEITSDDSDSDVNMDDGDENDSYLSDDNDLNEIKTMK